MSISANYPSTRPSLLLDFAESQTLDPRVTFTRSTTAVYYDGHTATLAEQNLLTYSQDFTNSAWTKSGTTASGTFTAPDGTTTANALIPSTSNVQHYCSRTAYITIQSGIAYTNSIYLKANGYNYVTVTLDGSGSTVWVAVNIDLSLGTISSTNQGAGATYLGSSITSVGNGWYRVSIAGSLTGTTAELGINFSATSSFSNGSYGLNPAFAGDGTSGAYIWGAQLEQRSSATAYNATTTSAITNYIPTLQTAPINTPRFDFNPVTGESLGLLIEQSSTNLLTYSQTFSNAAWTLTNATLTSASNIAPDGTQTVFTLVPNASAAFTNIIGTVVATAQAYTFTYYVKYNGIQFIQLMFGGGLTTNYANFDLVNGTVTAGTYTSASINSVGNGWYRIQTTNTFAAATSGVYLCPITTGTSVRASSYTGNGYSGIYIWGAQLEALAFPTSYIATTSSQVTRAADVATMTGTNFSSWFNQSQGTFYAEAISPTSVVNDGSGVAKGVLSANDNTNNNVIELAYQGTKYFVNTNNSTVILSASIGTLTANTLFKTACVYSNSYFVQARDGTVGTAVTTGLIPIVSQLNIGRGLPANGFWTGWIKKAAFYPQAITTSAQLQALTGS